MRWMRACMLLVLFALAATVPVSAAGVNPLSVLISYDGRPRLSGERSTSPVEERAQAYVTSFAYAGTYEIKRDTVVHRLEIATYPNWVGTDLVRTVVLDHDRLILRIAPRLVAGQMQSDELSWQRTRAP